MGRTIDTMLSRDTVNEAAAEATIEAKAIGPKIRSLRLKRSMGLVELGQQVGLSASFLSQLETGRIVPTLRNLARIALALKKDISYFFAAEEEAIFRVSQAKDRIRLCVSEKAAPYLVSDSMSMLIPERHVVPCVAEFLPGLEGAAFHPRLQTGLEFVYVIDGPLTLSTDKKTELLNTDDSAWIDAGTKRSYQCYEDKPARALIISFASQS